MNEDGSLLLSGCLEGLSNGADRPSNFDELLRSVERRPDVTSHLWCEHGALVGDILEALPPSLYEHEATLSLLTALEGEIVECVRCLQAYHEAQVWFPNLLTIMQGCIGQHGTVTDKSCMLAQRLWGRQGRDTLLSHVRMRDEVRLSECLRTATELRGGHPHQQC